MQYLNQSDDIWRASAPYSDASLFKCLWIQLKGYIEMANYMDFRSSQRL